MPKTVLTVTPSPALDLGGIVDRLIADEKSYVHDAVVSPGGNAINAARILRRLKVPVLATGFLGGHIGAQIKALLDAEGVKNRFIRIDGRSRVCVTVSNRSNHKQTRLTFPGPRIKARERAELFEFFKRRRDLSLLVIGGSLPPGLKSKDVLRLMKLAEKRGIPCIVDSPGSVVRELISGHPLLIKPNLSEFQEITGSTAENVAEVERKARRLLSSVPLVCVSSVEGGALLVTEDASYFGHIPRVQIKSTVGAGDSMVGAMVAHIYRGGSLDGELLRRGLAAAAATLEHRGTAFGKTSDIRRLTRATKVNKLY